MLGKYQEVHYLLGGEFGFVGFHKLVDGNLKKSLASLLPNHVS